MRRAQAGSLAPVELHHLQGHDHPNWLWLTGLMGGHLIQASFTGMCPVMMALKRMGLPSKPAFG